MSKSFEEWAESKDGSYVNAEAAWQAGRADLSEGGNGIMNQEWCYSYTGESYQGPVASREIAIMEAIEEWKDQEWDGESPINLTVSVAHLKDWVPEVNVAGLIEQVQDNAYDDLGECCEDWLTKVTKDKESDLQKRVDAVFKDWLDRHKLATHFWTVEKARDVKIVDGKEAGDE